MVNQTNANPSGIPGERDVGEFILCPLCVSCDRDLLQVALIGPNHVDSIVVTWAVLRLGGIILSVSNHTPSPNPAHQLGSGTDEPILVPQILHSRRFQNWWET